MFIDLLMSHVTSKLGANLIPYPDNESGGLDVWLKKFLLIGADEATVRRVSTEIQSEGHKQLCNMSGDPTDGTTVASEFSTLPQKGSEADGTRSCPESREDSPLSNRGQGWSEYTLDRFEATENVDGDGDQFQNDFYGSNSAINILNEHEDSEIATEKLPDYPAPAGLCREDSSLNFEFCGRNPSNENDTSYPSDVQRSAVVLSCGAIMSSSHAESAEAVEGASKTHLGTKDDHQDPMYSSAPSMNVLAAPDSETDASVLTPSSGLGTKGSIALMHEISKSALRFKDDLFVLSFASSPFHSSGVDLSTSDLWKKWLLDSNLDIDRFLCCFNNIITSGDTSDPDELTHSPFVDTRQTFLEMCQYRHYQFDSMRRAKHSSMMLLYHLHRPFQDSLRPTCVACRLKIKDVRWHCELCDNYDLCSRCVAGKIGSTHQHPLIPFRVTFV